MAVGKCGYAYNFEEDPPSSLECPICLLTLREPHVISCCGHHFCRPCLDGVRALGRPCPLCNELDFSSMLHKGVEREVKALRIFCPRKEYGCEWVGELGWLEDHIKPGAQYEGCGYVEVECPHHCGEKLMRNAVKGHERDLCTKRPVEVQLATIYGQIQELREEIEKMGKASQEKKEDNKEVMNILDELAQVREQQSLQGLKLAKREEEAKELRGKLSEMKSRQTEQEEKLEKQEAEMRQLREEIAQLKLKSINREVVWVDPNIYNRENSLYVSELKGMPGFTLTPTTKASEALTVLCKQKSGTEYRAITAGTGGEDFVKKLRSAGVRCRVLVFCANLTYHRSWAAKYSDVDVTVDTTEMFSFASWRI